MYVPGKISKPERPLVDIGTGYYAENVSLFNTIKYDYQIATI